MAAMHRHAASIGKVLVSIVWLSATVPVLAAGLEESPITLKGSTIAVPRSYGRLVSVVESNQIHYLYFEDSDGLIRVLLVGSKGTSLKANLSLEVLSANTYLLPRNNLSAPPQETSASTHQHKN